MLAVPGPLITAVTGGPVSSRVCTGARVLGARQLAQGTISCLVPTSGLIRAGLQPTDFMPRRCWRWHGRNHRVRVPSGRAR